MSARPIGPKPNLQGRGSRFLRLEVRRQDLGQEHLTIVRKNVTEVLRVLSRAEGGHLHYGVIQHQVNVEVGHHVSGIHLSLKALRNGGLVKKLDNKEGWQITRAGREFHGSLEKIVAISTVSNGNGGVGVP